MYKVPTFTHVRAWRAGMFQPLPFATCARAESARSSRISLSTTRWQVGATCRIDARRSSRSSVSDMRPNCWPDAFSKRRHEVWEERFGGGRSPDQQGHGDAHLGPCGSGPSQLCTRRALECFVRWCGRPSSLLVDLCLVALLTPIFRLAFRCLGPDPPARPDDPLLVPLRHNPTAGHTPGSPAPSAAARAGRTTCQ